MLLGLQNVAPIVERYPCGCQSIRQGKAYVIKAGYKPQALKDGRGGIANYTSGKYGGFVC